MKKVFLFLIFLIAVGTTQAQNEDFNVTPMTIMGEHALLVKTKKAGKVKMETNDTTYYFHSNGEFVVIVDEDAKVSFGWEKSPQRNPEYPLDFTSFRPCAYDDLDLIWDVTGKSKIKGRLENILPKRREYGEENGMLWDLEIYFLKLLEGEIEESVTWYEYYREKQLKLNPDIGFMEYIHAKDTLRYPIKDHGRFNWIKSIGDVEIRPTDK